MTYQEAVGILGKRTEKKLANNTTLIRRSDCAIAIKLHDTDIIKLYENGLFRLDTGGWRTVVTKGRLNEYMPTGSIHSDRGLWMYNSTPFRDGMVVSHVDGHIVDGGDADYVRCWREVDKLVSTFIKGFIDDIKVNGFKEPSSGDCWGCCMKPVDHGPTTTEYFGCKTTVVLHPDPMGIDHYLSHFSERYYVPSLLVNALQESGDLIKYKPSTTRCRQALARFFLRRKPALTDALIERKLRGIA